YLATVYKTTKKLVLWYVNEDEGAGAGPKLKEVNIPNTVDIGNWFSLRIDVYKNNITVFVEGNKLLSILDNRLPSGGPGLYTFSAGEVSFDSIMLIVLTTTETITTTKIVTSPTTTTKTITATSYQTTTITGAETTLTETKTQSITITIPSTSFLETIVIQTSTATVTEAITTTKTESVEVTKTAPVLTETITTTVTQGLGLKCLIATAAYGSEVDPQVQTLRDFRDNFVMKTFAGSNFMIVFNAFYYSWSPHVAEAEYRNPALKDIVKFMIYPLISSLEFSRSVSIFFSNIPELAVLISGLIASSLIALIYLTPIALITYFILKSRKINVNINIAYLLILFGASLLYFLVAEVLASSLLMMFTSSMIVLSMIMLTIAFSIRTFSVIGEKYLKHLKSSTFY
ncbi:MAG: CFI-box-CTERM domain-containing protein, partial [Nitrososphaerota archaeon]|nr:CFI-box-CTERM domain-containing protein [Nitrososphaerota archaeon]